MHPDVTAARCDQYRAALLADARHHEAARKARAHHHGTSRWSTFALRTSTALRLRTAAGRPTTVASLPARAPAAHGV